MCVFFKRHWIFFILFFFFHRFGRKRSCVVVQSSRPTLIRTCAKDIYSKNKAFWPFREDSPDIFSPLGRQEGLGGRSGGAESTSVGAQSSCQLSGLLSSPPGLWTRHYRRISRPDHFRTGEGGGRTQSGCRTCRFLLGCDEYSSIF